ncbi:MAG: Spore cortex-lytic enzyme, lytic transglycosylase SleB [Oscillospiraceae bacterium]|nr:Spore cortex-lytic enzyme, lytic transglycosylase SleB [Oscillospiraceae bacterium]
MKRMRLAILLALIFLLNTSGTAYVDTTERPVYINGTPLSQVWATEYTSGTTYVSLRAVATALSSQASVTWENGQAVVRTSNLTLTARPGNCYIEANGRCLYVAGGVLLSGQRIMIPVRVLAQAFDASVRWDASSNSIYITSGSGAILSGSYFYDTNSLYWLSHIISAESQSEPMSGQIAVGNVILNRIKSDEFPDTVYDVIFDREWGVQFAPVSIGSIYWEPAETSIIAAKLCLEGANVVGDALYFIDPDKAENLWVPESRTYITTIGAHDFYA